MYLYFYILHTSFADDHLGCMVFAWKVYLVSGTRVVSGVSGFWASSTLGRELGDKMRGRGLGPGTIFSSEYAKP